MAVWDYCRCNVPHAWPVTRNKTPFSIHPPLQLTTQYRATLPPVPLPCKRPLAFQAAAAQTVTVVSMPWAMVMAPTHVVSSPKKPSPLEMSKFQTSFLGVAEATEAFLEAHQALWASVEHSFPWCLKQLISLEVYFLIVYLQGYITHQALWCLEMTRVLLRMQHQFRTLE